MTTGDIESLLRRGEVHAALDIAKARLGQAREQHDDASVALALIDEARAQWAKGDRDDALMSVDEAIGTARRTFGAKDPRVAEAFEVGAEIAAGADMPHSAEARFAAALEILAASGIAGYARAHVLHHYGLFLHQRGDVEGAARAQLAAADDVRDATDPEGRALYPMALAEMGALALDAGQDADARELADRALERWVELRQARRYEVADALSVLGIAALRQGEPEVSANALQMACEIYGGSKIDVRLRLGRAEATRGEALAALGRIDEARLALTRALDAYREGADERMAIEERLLDLARS
jgi:tetratricopeptide (TPR) repeat protein